MLGFNGAAPARARNPSGMPSLGNSSQCFNGAADAADAILLAASTGPRPRGRGIPRLRRAGRALLPCFNGAAPARARNQPLRTTTRLARFSASTGPRPRGRGIRPQRLYKAVLQTGLQRGRARAGAESNTYQSCSQSQHCFNGAAPARARNHTIPFPRRYCNPSLQRGRARAGAESVWLSYVAAQRGLASTGPRPRGRGITISAAVLKPVT